MNAITQIINEFADSKIGDGGKGKPAFRVVMEFGPPWDDGSEEHLPSSTDKTKPAEINKRN